MARAETYPHDIFKALVQDHDRHRALIEQVEATEGETEERKRLFEELTKEIKGHAAAEEQALWSTILRKPETTAEARHAVAEHKELDDMFNQLAATDMSSVLSRLASSNTSTGAWPPSSMVVRVIFSAAIFASSFPTGIEPVKLSLRITFERRM